MTSEEIPEEELAIDVAAKYIKQHNLAVESIDGAVYYQDEEGGIWRVFCTLSEEFLPPGMEGLVGLPDSMVITLDKSKNVIRAQS